MSQVAKDKAERKEVMELRQTKVALRKEKEAYEALYVHSYLGYLRDDDSIRSNSLRRAMSESSKTSRGV